jgi:hypothetical protein
MTDAGWWGVVPSLCLNDRYHIGIAEKQQRRETVASTYVRRFNLKDSLSDTQVRDFWRFLLGEFVPAIQKSAGINAVKVYSGAGALRADIRLVLDMDHAGRYEGLLREPTISKQLGAFYGAMDLTTSTQMFIREVTPDLLKALSS